jgi:PTH1 family peptidyl-tRNA hydrolase
MPEHGLKLVVGLGNPGPQYVCTRHNAGFWLVEALALRYGGTFRLESKFRGELCRIQVSSQDIWLFKPLVFMNRSGQAVSSLAGFYKILPPDMLIAHDDLDLPPGTVRLKRAGGHGGHNGLRDLIRHLGINDFLRLRLGIGHPGNSRDVTDYVLRRAPGAEQQLIECAVDDAIREFPLLVEGQLEKAMHALHSRQVDFPPADKLDDISHQ